MSRSNQQSGQSGAGGFHDLNIRAQGNSGGHIPYRAVLEHNQDGGIRVVALGPRRRPSAAAQNEPPQEPPQGPKFRYCYSVSMQACSQLGSIPVNTSAPDSWMLLHMVDAHIIPTTTSGAAAAAAFSSTVEEHTVETKVTQDPNSRFPLTMLTQTRLWSPTYGSLPPGHDHGCLEPGEAGEEVVIAYIRLGFCMPCNVRFTFDTRGRAQTLHTHDTRERLPHALPRRAAPDEDVADARQMLEWSLHWPATDAFGGLVPCVKDTLRYMVRQILEEGTWDPWHKAEAEFEAAIRPLDDEMVVAALSGAIAQIREASRDYERAKSSA